MSRIGMKPVEIPSGVKVAVAGRTVSVEGSLGKLTYDHRPEVTVVVEGDAVNVTRNDEERQTRAYHGLTRSLIANMVEGVSKGYQRSLEVYGVGYGVQQQGDKFTVTCGKSHPEILDVPMGITIDIQTPQARGDTDPAKFTVKGYDKQLVGEFAACCRRTRPPEPYKGKGVRYSDEYVRRKVGKAFAGGGA
ncbi:MAG: 50S ribosomal protein L6 [Phycisphaerae bacterium]|nr:50S ribosomal protein L6 [Phycisphaerae bacterium]